MRGTVWQCEQLRAGRVYQRMSFGSKEEAEHFVAQMRGVAPDLFFRIEAVDANSVWN